MRIPDITIAIDGYSSTGKSTLAKLIAQHFDFLYLDSGALYRGVTLFAQEQGLIAPDNTVDPALEKALEGLDLHFEPGTVLHMGGRNIEKKIRTMEVSSQVSPIAAVPYVRKWVDARLHAFSEAGRVVMDGRDIGTVVFPHAELKVFVTADAAIRAQRRYAELKASGKEVDYEQVLENVRQRDQMDEHRADSPLRKADDALLLDNGHLTHDEQNEWMYQAYLKACQAYR